MGESCEYRYSEGDQPMCGRAWGFFTTGVSAAVGLSQYSPLLTQRVKS